MYNTKATGGSRGTYREWQPKTNNCPQPSRWRKMIPWASAYKDTRTLLERTQPTGKQETVQTQPTDAWKKNRTDTKVGVKIGGPKQKRVAVLFVSL